MTFVRGSKFAEWNGFVYTGGIIVAFFSSRVLVELLPENPFRAQIFVCGLLLWMLAFGSFLIWSDQTLLFQAVPSIAIFGLVGCYDTYRDAVWLFFGFLLCFATMLARVHSRTMLRQAKESGYSQTGDRMDRSATELERMRSGPWKWVAGPQWALGSAFVVILFSFIGAPLIRESVQGVAGAVRVQTPISSRNNSSVPVGPDATTMSIGRGPNQVSDLPSFRATLDRPRYLRTGTYQIYAESGWRSLSSGLVGDKSDAVLARSTDRGAIRNIRDKKEIEFAIEPLTARLSSVPIPGELNQIEPVEPLSIRMDATLVINQTGLASIFHGKSIVDADLEEPKNALRNLPDGQEVLLSTQNIPPTVFNLANQAAASGKTDYERAQLIRQEIARRVKYNLNAEATPSGRDPVETFLFDTKEGYCDLFASSMALMARCVGIPSRLVVGYYPILQGPDESGRYTLHDSERHAWAELYFEGHGWVVFDATEDAEAVPGGELGSNNTGSMDGAGIFKQVVEVAIGLGVLILIFITVKAYLQSLKAGPARTDLDREYLKFAGALAHATGKVRAFDQTPREYVQQSVATPKVWSERAKQLNSKFERYFYSESSPGGDDLKSLRREVAEFRKQVKSAAKVA
jgi:transglutaminase-like putative cysteine protease